jgi:hypothetical protein
MAFAMKSAFAFGVSLTAAALLFALAPACSSTNTINTTPGPTNGLQTTCDPTQCGEKNQCLQGNGELKCRRACSSNNDPATNCPAGATCIAANVPSTIPPECAKGSDEVTQALCAGFGTGGGLRLNAYACGETVPKECVASATPGTWCCNDAPAETYATPFCVKLLRDVKPGPKQWGAGCNATCGLDMNPDCDTAQGFYCYGTSPADGASYCTRYDCNSDRECAPNFYCATINVGPNVTTPKPTHHQTTKVCLRRDYCAPCAADLDCPTQNGLTQHCVPDSVTGAGLCAPECTTSANCNFEAKCIDVLGTGTKTCYPRAGACSGDGSLCSPCHNDAECGDDGLCVKGQYTTEHACAKKSGVACADKAKQCPTSAAPKAQIGCTQQDSAEAPANYCVGLYNFADNADIGCWTPAR